MANDNYNSSPFTPQYTLIQKIKELQDHVKTIYDNEDEFNNRITELESKSIQVIVLENVDLSGSTDITLDFSAADYGKAGGTKNCKLFIVCSYGPSEYGARRLIFELSKFKQDLSLNEISFSANIFDISSDNKYVDTISAVATLSLQKIRIKFARFNFTNLIINSLETNGNALIGNDLDVDGDLTVFGETKCEDLNANGSITGDSIIENMHGYSFESTAATGYTFSNIYASAAKNGNKLTLVVAFDVIKTADAVDNYPNVGVFTIPREVLDKIYPSVISNVVDAKQLRLYTTATASVLSNSYISKTLNKLYFVGHFSQAVIDTRYYFRYEVTFLLGENLATNN